VTLARAPLVPPALAFGTGIALAPLMPPPLAWAIWVATLAAGTGLLGMGLTRSATVPVLAGMVALGALRGAEPPLPADHVGRLALPRTLRVEGRVAQEPDRWVSDRTRLLIDVEQADGRPVSGRIQLTLYGQMPTVDTGQRVAVEVRLHRATSFRNPGTFDYAAHLAREGVHVVGTARVERFATLGDGHPRWPVRMRRAALEALDRALPPTSAALLGGLLLGDRTRLPRDLDDAFRRAGVYHILAVSGFNVALLAASVWTLARLARVGRRTGALTAIVIITGFALVAGAEPSVVRAVVMAGLVLTALVLERDASVANSLGVAALAILAVRPGDLFDPGFQLSFAATAGIVAAPLPRGRLGSSLGVSTAAQLAVLPITLSHFNQASTIGVLANLGAVPLAGAATIGGLAAVGLALVSDAAAQVAFDLVWLVLLALRGIVALAASVPSAVVHLPTPHWSAVVCYAAALLGGRAWWPRAGPEGATARRQLAIMTLALLVTAVTIGAWPMIRPADGWLRVIVLDVGQGDAIVVETPDGRAVLIDAGAGGPARLDAGERVVAPFLWNRGHLRLAATTVTHLDTDHAGGMPTVRRLFGDPARLTAEGLAREPYASGGAVLSLLRTAPPHRGAATEDPQTLRGRPANNDAMVLRLDYGLASFLFAADIEAGREAALVAAGAPLLATVLKVPHHGARGASTAPFVAAVHPAVAVVSVGARNVYGHPDRRTLDRLAASGARILRTDRDGAVILETDGRTLTVTGWASRARERFCLDPDTIC